MNPMIAFIEHLLYTHDCVIIPHFGGFVLNSQDFKLDDEQVIHPKSKWVAFNERLQSDDGLLATLWAKEKNISQKQAFATVHQFGQTLAEQIKADKQFKFGNIGVFQISKSGRLQFEPNKAINFDRITAQYFRKAAASKSTIYFHLPRALCSMHRSEERRVGKE